MPSRGQGAYVSVCAYVCVLCAQVFPASFERKVLMSKVNLETFRPWISDKVEGYVGYEDDIIVEMVRCIDRCIHRCMDG